MNHPAIASKLIWGTSLFMTFLFFWGKLSGGNLSPEMRYGAVAALTLLAQFALTTFQTSLWTIKWSSQGATPLILLFGVVCLGIDTFLNVAGMAHLYSMFGGGFNQIELIIASVFGVLLAVSPELLQAYAKKLAPPVQQAPVKQPAQPQRTQPQAQPKQPRQPHARVERMSEEDAIRFRNAKPVEMEDE